MIGGKFRRGIAPARLEQLRIVAMTDGWLRDLLARWQPAGVSGGLRLAVRDGYLNFYGAGQSVARVDFGRDGAPYASVHHKYVLADAPPTYVRFGADAKLDVDSVMARAAAHVGLEKRGVEAFVAAEPGVIDLEMGLPAQGDRTTALRIDLVALEPCGDGLRLVLWEAKRIGDARLRAAEGSAEVVGQSRAYRAFVADNAPDIAAAYQETARVLVALAAAAGRQDVPGEPIRRLASGAPLAVDPVPRLLIVDDGRQRDPAAWSHHHRKLHDAGIPVHIASLTNASLPTAEALAAMPPPERIAPADPSFVAIERKRQQDWADRQSGMKPDGLWMPDLWSNIDPRHRALAEVLFKDKAAPIQPHRAARHLLSSQAACVNFLLPMMNDRNLLASWVAGLFGLDEVEIRPIETRAGAPRDIAFEWFPAADYLNEGLDGKRIRGANSTSVDAAVQFRAGGATRLALIEWKYTESYGAPLGGRHATRVQRYQEVWHRLQPVRANTGLQLTDFFQEPFYQLLRQQMLALAIEKDPNSGIDRADVVHISPAGNRALHRITSPTFDCPEGDAFLAFTASLSDACRDRFHARTTAQAFAKFRADMAFAYVDDRYAPLLAGWPE